MARVDNILEMWLGSENVHATQKKTPTLNKHMSAVRHISDTEEIINAFWSNVQHDGAAASQS